MATSERHEYSTADFRKNMTDVFETARFKGKIVDVSHHGKTWVSIMSPENAEHIRNVHEIGVVEVSEIRAIADSLNSSLEVTELVEMIRVARAKKVS